MEEVQGADITTLTKGHNLFEGNICSFESGYRDRNRDHVNYLKENNRKQSK